MDSPRGYPIAGGSSTTPKPPTQTLFSEGGFIRREPKTFRPSVFAPVDGDAKTEAGRQIQKRLTGQDPDKPKGFIKRVRPVGSAGGN